MDTFRVRKPALFFTAGILWLIAGVNILRIGVGALQGSASAWLLAAGALVIFIGFAMMFMKIVQKHKKRILGYPQEKNSIFLCFDRKGYLLMLFMMTLGIVLRKSNLFPAVFFAVFYSGLGAALCFGGLMFIGFGLKCLQG
ncbi:MAG: hypothetical protein IJ418_16805 [Clostridia bacterium]|nr:hypothetical protein [Clostridia bacterium]